MARQSPAAVGRIWNTLCTTCGDGVPRAAFEVAREHGISLIVQGGCPVEPDLAFLKVAIGSASRSYALAALCLALRSSWDVATVPFFHNPLYFRNVLRHLKAFGLLSRSLTNRFHLPAKTSPRYNSSTSCPGTRAKSWTCSAENWGGKNRTTRLHGAFRLHDPPASRGTLRKYLGVTEREQMYSLMIRKGMLSRQESIARVEVESQEDRVLLPGAVRDILARLGMAQDMRRLRRFGHLRDSLHAVRSRSRSLRPRQSPTSTSPARRTSRRARPPEVCPRGGLHATPIRSNRRKFITAEGAEDR